MSHIAIKAEGLSKQYKIGARQERHDTLRDQLATGLRRFGRASRSADSEETTIWALKDISFEVKRGEVVGVIGRNGAGKSTLLKVLSRITEPSSGFADVTGRVGSLLEIGTGFHPELTGRENIYLNGAILGMRRAEITRKFDEIVAFAEVEKFIDTPVKRFSSGMYVRLAFAVAAHMDTEILLIDEVLAVGDVEFQKKCLGKMRDVAREDRTILFVSHNLGQIGNLCERALWLNRGTYSQSGPAAEVIAAYRKSMFGDQQSAGEAATQDEYGFTAWGLIGQPGGNDPHVLYSDRDVTIELTLRLRRAVYSTHLELTLESQEGQKITGWAIYGLALDAGEHQLRFILPYLPVPPGVYTWRAKLWDGATQIDSRHLFPEIIVATQDYGGLEEAHSGIINIPYKLETKLVSHLSNEGHTTSRGS